jgi:hypothetical protein
MNIFKLDNIFSSELREKLLHQAPDNIFQYHYSIASGKKMTYETCSTLHDPGLNITNEYQEAWNIVCKNICEPTSMCLLRLASGVDMKPHIDGHHNKHRETVMLTLLGPMDYPKETRLEFYDENMKVTDTHYYDQAPIFAATKTIHNAWNDTPHIRYSFQMSFAYHIEELAEMYDSRKKLR